MSRHLTRRIRPGERGFALLLVFAMAAAAVVLLYLEMPRVGFEYQRNKEGLLVERGEQFVRAITLYYRKNQRLPQNLDELENTNNLRYLRKRYRDPITGEDEWRLVHVDAAGQYLDSLVHKRQGQAEERGPSVLAATIQGIGSEAQYIPGAGPEDGSNPALQRRASDRIIPGLPGAQGQPAEEQPQPEGETGRSGPAPGDTAPPGVLEPDPAGVAQQQPGMDLLGAGQTPQNPSGPAEPGTVSLGTVVNPNAPGQGLIPGQPGRPGPAGQAAPPGAVQVVPDGSAGAGTGGSGFGFSGGFGSSSPAAGTGGAVLQQPIAPQPFTGGTSGAVPPGAGPKPPAQPARSQPGAGAPPGAMEQIRNLLTGQRPGQPAPGPGAAQGSGLLGSGGLVGVASKAEMRGIMVYNERTNIKEWEFLFDLQKAAQAAAAPAGSTPQNPAQPPSGTRPGMQMGSPGPFPPARPPGSGGMPRQ